MRDPSTRILDTPGNPANPTASATVAETTRPAAAAPHLRDAAVGGHPTVAEQHHAVGELLRRDRQIDAVDRGRTPVGPPEPTHLYRFHGSRLPGAERAYPDRPSRPSRDRCQQPTSRAAR